MRMMNNEFFKTGFKKIVFGMTLTFIYSMALFMLAYIATLFLVWIADAMIQSVSVDVLIYSIGALVFLFLTGIELFAVFKGVFWTPITVVILIPILIFEIVVALIEKTDYNFDLRNPPEKIKKLKGNIYFKS